MAVEMIASRTVQSGTTRFSYLDEGWGPALVLLHGIGSGARSWRLQVDSLSARFRVLAWDAPGYGTSSALRREQPLADDYEASLLHWLDTLGVGPVHLVGHSLGTVMALRFAAEHPERILSLTLASMSSGHARLSEEERVRLREARLQDLAALGPKGMAEKRGPRLLSPNATEAQKQAVIETMSLINCKGYKQAVRMLSHADTRSDLARLPDAMRVQIVFGDADVVTTPESIRAIATQRPQTPVHVIAGAGHALYLEKPEAFNAVLTGFIEECGTAETPSA
jgi:pimeloyl-ACP methyl ester carboxylesterase